MYICVSYVCVISIQLYIHMGWLRLVGSIKVYVSFVEYSLFYRALLQKGPIILSILLIKAAPYLLTNLVFLHTLPLHTATPIATHQLQHTCTTLVSFYRILLCFIRYTLRQHLTHTCLRTWCFCTHFHRTLQHALQHALQHTCSQT